MYAATMGYGATAAACRSRTRATGFSLIELVVVIGIVMILVGLILPSLGRVRDQGSLTRYLAEIQQSAALIEMFADAHDDEYPFANPKNLGDCSVKWYKPLEGAGLIEGAGLDSAAQFEMSLCMAFDADQMTPENTPDQNIWDVETPRQVRRRETRYPSDKGLLYRLFAVGAVDEQYPTVWCCYPTLPKGPIAMADSSVKAATWAEFLPNGVLEIDQTSGVGYPVITTWYGVKGRDR